MNPTEAFAASWPYVLGVVEVVAVLLATVHVVLRKDNVSSAIGWVGLIWLAPLVGSVLYLVLGVNRVKRTGRRRRPRPIVARALDADEPDVTALFAGNERLGPLASAARVSNAFSMTVGNAIEPLETGDVAYPAMLDAIRHAERSVVMSTYIFDRDPVGMEFADALTDATRRGVAVRVLIDAVGARYSAPSMLSELRHRGVRSAAFMPSWVPWAMPYLNLRNHRKLLVVDGVEAFTGGMNIRASCVLSSKPRHPTRDTHFRVRGPVVHQLTHVFAEDWAFTTREVLEGAPFAPAPAEPAGTLFARGVPDGPDYDLERLLWKRLALISQAEHRIRIVTPYFLPETRLFSALELAAMRGVEVDIVMPATNNLRFVAWAATHQLRPLLRVGCHVHLTPPPFDHTKLFVVDGAATMLGSANWDTRSTRLNFELDLECYDPTFAGVLGAMIDERIRAAKTLTLAEYDERTLLPRIRDGLAWLFSPYL